MMKKKRNEDGESAPDSTNTLPTVASDSEFRAAEEGESHPDDQHPEIHPFGEDDLNLWTAAVPDSTDVELYLHMTDSHGHLLHQGAQNKDDTCTSSLSHSGSNPPYREDDLSDTDANEESSPPCSFLRMAVEVFKYAYSTVLLVFCVVVVCAAILTRQTTATGEFNVHPAVAFPLFWFLLWWLAFLEAGLNCIVGLYPVNKALYADSHPRSLRCMTRAHKGDNIERFIVGRQFLDLLTVFVTSFMVSAIDDAHVLGLPEVVTNIFLKSGFALTLVTVVFAQLTPQINAAHSMLDFTNNYVYIVIPYLALIVDASGLLHAVYLIQIVVAKVMKRPIMSHEKPRNRTRNILFWGRVAASTVILLFSMVTITMAIFEGKTAMWDGVPPIVTLIILVVLILLTGMMDALQIAFFTVVHQGDVTALEKHRIARINCKLVFAGKNLQTFLIGRQLLSTVIMFLIARITTVHSNSDEENLFGASDGLQKFFGTGLLGAFFATIIASLAWRVLASSFPMAFLSNPLASIIIYMSILSENSGICYSSWLVAAANKYAMGFKPDEDYIGKTTAGSDPAAVAAAAAVSLDAKGNNDVGLMEEAYAKKDEDTESE